MPELWDPPWFVRESERRERIWSSKSRVVDRFSKSPSHKVERVVRDSLSLSLLWIFAQTSRRRLYLLRRRETTKTTYLLLFHVGIYGNLQKDFYLNPLLSIFQIINLGLYFLLSRNDFILYLCSFLFNFWSSLRSFRFSLLNQIWNFGFRFFFLFFKFGRSFSCCGRRRCSSVQSERWCCLMRRRTTGENLLWAWVLKQEKKEIVLSSFVLTFPDSSPWIL